MYQLSVNAITYSGLPELGFYLWQNVHQVVIRQDARIGFLTRFNVKCSNSLMIGWYSTAKIHDISFRRDDTQESIMPETSIVYRPIPPQDFVDEFAPHIKLIPATGIMSG